MFLQDRDDLLFCVALALHVETSLGSKYKEIPHTTWLGLRGYGQGITEIAGHLAFLTAINLRERTFIHSGSCYRQVTTQRGRLFMCR